MCRLIHNLGKLKSGEPTPPWLKYVAALFFSAVFALLSGLYTSDIYLSILLGILVSGVSCYLTYAAQRVDSARRAIEEGNRTLLPAIDALCADYQIGAYLATIKDAGRSVGRATLPGFILKTIVEHIWKLEQATAKTGYRLLNNALEHATTWEGVHMALDICKLSEIGSSPLDSAGTTFLKALRDTSDLSRKRRIIFVSKVDFVALQAGINSTKDAQTLKTEIRREIIDGLIDVWETSGQGAVECLFSCFDEIEDTLRTLLSARRKAVKESGEDVVLPDEADIESICDDDEFKSAWPDCVLHDRNLLVAWKRNKDDTGPIGAIYLCNAEFTKSAGEREKYERLGRCLRVLFDSDSDSSEFLLLTPEYMDRINKAREVGNSTA